MPLHALFQAQAGTGVEPLTFRKLAKLSDRINRIIGLVPLNGESISGSAAEVIRFCFRLTH